MGPTYAFYQSSTLVELIVKLVIGKFLFDGLFLLIFRVQKSFSGNSIFDIVTCKTENDSGEKIILEMWSVTMQIESPKHLKIMTSIIFFGKRLEMDNIF